MTAEALKLDENDPQPRPAVGHMPFVGHRTVATVWAQQAAARKRIREVYEHRRAMEFGFDPDSLKDGK